MGDGERCGREGLRITEPPGSTLTERMGAQAPSPPTLAPCLAPLLRGSQREVSTVLSLLLQWLAAPRAVVSHSDRVWPGPLEGPAAFWGRKPGPFPVPCRDTGLWLHSSPPAQPPSLPWAGPWWRSPRLLSALCVTLFCSCYQERARRFGSQGLHSYAGPRLQGSPSPRPVGTAVPLQRPGASSANCSIPALERREPWLPCCASAQVSSAAEPPGPL